MTVQKQANGWQLNNKSYYKWSEENEELFASIIYHNEHDGAHQNQYGVQIHPTDGGIVVIGYINKQDFNPDSTKLIADRALAEQKTYDWWIKNYKEWWTDVVIGNYIK